jgi:DNA processing protein
VTPQDVEYPPLLAECEDRPPFLFVRGELECLGARTLSVVGTRKPSLGGRKATAELTAAAVSAGQVIVSGLALGIDGIAHQAALQAGGASIAVLPCGIDRVYPRRHTVLAERLIKVGAVVSEFPLGTPPRKHHFHRRNRTLSGFSMSTLVVEAGRPSGTLLTASAAADQGRDVLTLPWSIYHVGGAGCRYLLSDGATLIQSAEDLLLHLGVHAAAHVDVAVCDALGGARACSDSAHQPKLARHVAESDQQILLRLLGGESHSAEACSIALGWHVDRCLQGLSALEIAGRVVRSPHGYSALP